jgi:hypothetical protein
MPRTDQAFSGNVARRFYDDNRELMTLEFREDDIVKTLIDPECTLSVLPLDSALGVLESAPTISIATASTIVKDLTVSEKQIVTRKHLWFPSRRWLRFTFTVARTLAKVIALGTAVQVFGVDPNGTCQAGRPPVGRSGGTAG